MKRALSALLLVIFLASCSYPMWPDYFAAIDFQGFAGLRGDGPPEKPQDGPSGGVSGIPDIPDAPSEDEDTAGTPSEDEDTAGTPSEDTGDTPDAAPVSPEPSPPGNTPDIPSPAPETEIEVSGAADESVPGDKPVISDLAVNPAGLPPDAVGLSPDTALSAYNHYIPQNEARYLAFIGAFPDMAESAALALVNVNADYGFYNEVTTVENPAALLVLCNKNFQLPSDYVPQDLRKVAGSDLLMSGIAAEAFERMRAAIKEELGLSLVPVSGYRSYEYQKSLFARYARADGAAVAETYSARAGHSEHQTGLTLDFLHKYPSGSLRSANFQNTAQYAWLLEHAHQFGYILRYREGAEPVTGYLFEPWHWRYIGVEDATRMFEEGIATFDEYIGTYYPEGAGAAEAG